MRLWYYPMLLISAPVLEGPLKFTPGMKQLVSPSILHLVLQRRELILLKLQKELWSFRTSVKRIACTMVTNYYALTPSDSHLQEWYSKSNISLGTSATRHELIMAFRAEKIAELTGSGDTERLANFIYEVDVSLGDRCHRYC